MAKYHDIAASIWDELYKLTAHEQLLYIFFFSNPLCRPSGLYHLELDRIPALIGSLTTPQVEGASKGLIRGLPGASKGLPAAPLIHYDFDTSEVWVRGKLKHFRNIANNNNLRKSIESDLDQLKSKILKDLFLEKYGRGLEGALEGLGSPPSHSQSHSQSLEKKKEYEKKEKPKWQEFDGLTKQQRHVLKQIEEMRNERRTANASGFGFDSSLSKPVV